MHQTTSWRTCPCDDCRARTRTYNRDAMRDYRKNPGPRLTDRAATAAHIDQLRDAGMTLREIADRSGYPYATLHSVMSGRVERVRTVMAEDILTIPVRSAAA